ncbi:MAG TPA: hypothetical protein ENI64_01030 [Gammaproteobacteria bacterium]|nr:hypothetical protein [Gammaproteobacteria bacterium]
MSNRKKRYHRVGYLTGIVVSLLGLAVLLYPENNLLSAPGSMNTGHETLSCNVCHLDAKGSLRQRLQANVQYLFGNRNNPVVLGHREVGNSDCLACHDRPEDRHPVYRFLEPRYAKVRREIQVQFCTSCHREHEGKRVTQKTGFCVNCHDELLMRKDPLDIPHVTLIKEKRWESCLGCHDFHGNHIFTETNHVKEAWAENEILTYFNGGKSPYSKKRHYQALKVRSDAK